MYDPIVPPLRGDPARLDALRRELHALARVKRSLAGIGPEDVNDRAKLVFHRLVARALPARPDILVAAREVAACWASDSGAPTYAREWADLLTGDLAEVRRRITARGCETRRLRLSSPFYHVVPCYTDETRLRVRVAAYRGFVPNVRAGGQSPGHPLPEADPPDSARLGP